MIQIDGLSKVYGSRARAVTALCEVSMVMGPGVWGVVGPNGAGKTTLLGLILGFLDASDGSVTIDGRPPRRYLRRHGAAYLPERFSLPAAWPVRSALHGLALLEGRGAEAASDRVDSALHRMGLTEHADRPVGELSRGLTQRVGIAQALLADRALVVLDEPTEGLDPLWRVRFRELLSELRKAGRTVLLASHDLAEVERLADRVLVLHDGRVTDVMEARPSNGARRFRISIDAPPDRVRAAFPHSTLETVGDLENTTELENAGELERSGSMGSASVAENGTYVVEVSDAAELSHRLAALLDAGGIVRSVVPVADDLETRVRHRLEER